MDFDRMLGYASALAQNNRREWFHEHHGEYAEARGDFVQLLELMRFSLSDASPELGSSIMHMNVKDWMYRTARDARIYKNAPPYNPAWRAYIAADRRSWGPIGYFLSIFPGESLFGTGVGFRETEAVNRVRIFIAEHFEEFDAIRRENRLTIEGDALKRTPCGYDDSHPAAEWIRHKSWLIVEHIPDRKLTDFTAFCRLAAKTVKRMEPMRLFLLRAVGMEPGREEE